ncbi:MAG: MGDG synthase family glycosyltransferase [Verrucomicrobiales bacterium]|nr:hypothetical protein [Verrucomicrobiota bacterium JB025]
MTAAFGEGHNSAARNLALALEDMGVTVRVEDPCFQGLPVLTPIVSKLYRGVTTHAPRLWARIYKSTDQCDFSKERLSFMRKPERALAGVMEEFKPDAVVSTYPLYPYHLERIFAADGRRVPIFTAVTDSIEINAAWMNAPTDWWLVTDGATRDAMVGEGLDPGRIVDTGFPVHPKLGDLRPLSAEDGCDPFRVLYFPTAKLPYVRRHSKALLNADERVTLTIVLGKNVRRLYSRAAEIKRAYPGRVRLVGWTRRVPEYLSRHHLVVGKAGGATVHESIAARCPMLIHHLVPGQEEGNLRLLEQIGGGYLAETPEKLGARVADLLADGQAGWRSMKRALAVHGHSLGAVSGARFILKNLAEDR